MIRLPDINHRHRVQCLVFSLPLIVAVLMSMVAVSYQPIVAARHWLKPVHVNSIEEIERLFSRLAYDWPLATGHALPRLLIESLPDELSADLSVPRKKALFLRILLPVVLAENQRIRQQRAWLQQRLAKAFPETGSLAEQQLRQLANDYRINGDLSQLFWQQKLLQRVDEVPVALVLAQAANESGWGTSRFVQQANNLFGHWTFRPGQGLVPLQRDDDKQHRLRIFTSLRASVQAYLHNLNTGHAYRHLRQLRANLRENKQPLDGEHLAAGLIHYSERGLDYVEEIRGLISSNQLSRFDTMQLRVGTWRMSIK